MAGFNVTGESAFHKLFPFPSSFFQVGQNRIHYVDIGEGPVLLLLHACPLWSFSFRNLIADFSKDHRVVAYDQMGFGLSDKPKKYDYRLENHTEVLESFIHHLGLRDITLIMHGRGTTIGMAYAVHNADNVRAFVTMNAMTFSDFSLPWRLQLCRLKWIGAHIIMGLNLFTKDSWRLPRDIRACYALPFEEKGSETALLKFIEDIPSVPEDDSAQSMFEIESSLWTLRGKPSTILWARKDWLYTMKSFRKWVQYFPDAEVHLLDRAGRYLPEDAPEELSWFIRDFLERNKC